jgi:hypothetical protein
MDARTDQELVTGSRPGAEVQSRKCPLTWATEYRVTHAPAPGQPDPRHPWCPTAAGAWRSARVRLGLRADPD